jgi:hypothetical protein
MHMLDFLDTSSVGVTKEDENEKEKEKGKKEKKNIWY